MNFKNDMVPEIFFWLKDSVATILTVFASFHWYSSKTMLGSIVGMVPISPMACALAWDFAVFGELSDGGEQVPESVLLALRRRRSGAAHSSGDVFPRNSPLYLSLNSFTSASAAHSLPHPTER